MRMPTSISSSRNWFDQGGLAYAHFRPAYPAALAAFLASQAPHRRLAVDAGCGNGQLTQLLAPGFARVLGIDPSADQIAHALPDERIDYRCAPAERIPADDGSAGLITAAQAAHWFDLPAFYREVRRIGSPGAILALVSYGVLKLESDLDARFQAFYHDEIGRYWPPERRLVDTGYATLDFPFAELAPPALQIDCTWSLPAFLGYVATWSAVRHAREAGGTELMTVFAHELAALWGDPDRKRPVCWPINMRLGQL
jgi:SAM-dependent methyltransferase